MTDKPDGCAFDWTGSVGFVELAKPFTLGIADNDRQLQMGAMVLERITLQFEH